MLGVVHVCVYLLYDITCTSVYTSGSQPAGKKSARDSLKKVLLDLLKVNLARQGIFLLSAPRCPGG
jgi:hypothetical protein